MSKMLVDAFNSHRREQLKGKLKYAEDLRRVFEILQEELAFYSNLNNQYLSELTESEARASLAALSILRESNNTINSSVLYKKNKVSQSHQVTDKKKSSADTILISVGAGFGTSLGLIFGSGFNLLSGHVGAAVIGAMLGSGIAKTITKMVEKKSDRDISSPAYDYQFKLNIDILILELEKLFSKVDKLVLNKRSNSTIDSSQKNSSELSDFPEIIKYLQKLLNARYADLPSSLEYYLFEELPSLLQAYDFQVHKLSNEEISKIDSLSEELGNLYEIIMTNEVETASMELPSILKDGDIFIKGKIYAPTQ